MKHALSNLASVLIKVGKWPDVASATIWEPDADALADGIGPEPQLHVTIWRSHRNSSDIACDIERMGLRRVGEGSDILGPCFVFVSP